MASNITNASDYSSGVSGREGFGYSGDTSDTSYVGDDPSGGEIGLAGLFSPNAFSDMDSRGEGGRTGGRADFGVGYGRASLPTAQNILAKSGLPTLADKGTGLNMNEFMALKGISAADPFAGSKKFGFSDYFDLDYRGQRDTIDDLQRQYAQYYNPYGGELGIGTVVPSKDSSTGLDQTSLDAMDLDFKRLNKNPNIQGDVKEGDLRAGLNKGYGSLFGGSTGLQTILGEVVEQDRQFTPGEMVARSLISLAPGPIGTILSQIGKTKQTLDTSETYKKALDPNSPDYEGSSSYLGQMFDMYTGGAGSQIAKKTYEEILSLADGVDFLYKPTNDKVISNINKNAMTDPNYKGSALDNVGITSLDPEANNAVNNAVANDINIPTSISSRVNASSQKTRKELDAIGENTKEMTLDETMKKFDDEIAGIKKEGLDFRNLTAKDRENMTLEELIELKNRMNDLGSLSK